MNVQAVWLGLAFHGVKPTDLVGIRADDAGILFECGISSVEVTLHDAIHIASRLETFDPTNVVARLDGIADSHFPLAVHELTEHAGSKLGEAHTPDSGFSLHRSHPVVGGRVAERIREPSGETCVFETDKSEWHGRVER